MSAEHILKGLHPQLRVYRAYEIKTLHKREPPPREILEDLTAKGGDLLHRTVENFRPPTAGRPSLSNGQDSDGSGAEESKTPKEDKMEVDEPGSGGARTSRGEHLVERLKWRSSFNSRPQKQASVRPLPNGSCSSQTCRPRARSGIHPATFSPLLSQQARLPTYISTPTPRILTACRYPSPATNPGLRCPSHYEA